MPRATWARDLSPDEQAQCAALAAMIVADLALNTDDLTAAILAGRMAAWNDTAQGIYADLGIEDDPPPPDDAALSDDARASADQIAATWRDDATAAAMALAVAWLLAHGTLNGARAPLTRALHAWGRDHTTWKAAQIANQESGTAAHAALLVALALILSDGTDYGGTPAALTITVWPDTAAEAFCAQFSGKTYPASDYGDIGPFPAHQNCPHWISVNS